MRVVVVTGRVLHERQGTLGHHGYVARRAVGHVYIALAHVRAGHPAEQGSVQDFGVRPEHRHDLTGLCVYRLAYLPIPFAVLIERGLGLFRLLAEVLMRLFLTRDLLEPAVADRGWLRSAVVVAHNAPSRLGRGCIISPMVGIRAKSTAGSLAGSTAFQVL